MAVEIVFVAKCRETMEKKETETAHIVGAGFRLVIPACFECMLLSVVILHNRGLASSPDPSRKGEGPVYTVCTRGGRGGVRQDHMQ